MMNTKLFLLILLFLPIASQAIPVDSITVEGAATFSAGTANTVPYLDGSKGFTSSAVTPTELGYMSGVTSSIQTQLGNKEPTITATTAADYYRGDKTFQNFTSAAQASVVTQVITNGVTATAPSEDALFDALALKQNSLTFGNLTDTGTDGITVTSGTGAVIGAGTSIDQHVSDSTHNGYLSSVDWSTFNAKLTSTLADTKIFVGNGSNIATAVFASGDLTLADTGAFTIANLAVTNAKIANSTIDLTAKVTGALPVANGGTNKTSWTAGSIAFAGAGGTSLTENTGFPFSWDNTNSRLNIGATGTGKINVTAAGGTDLALNVFSTAANNAVQIQNQSGYSLSLTNAAASATAGASIGGAFSRGTLAARTQSLAGDQLFSLSSQGYTGSAFGPGLSGAISFVATENTTATANGNLIAFSTTPNTALVPVTRMTIGQNGVINIANLTASLPVQTDASKNLVSAAITLSGSQVTGILANANTTAASANTASAIVTRDGSGNFSAGTITASLTGHASLDLALTGGTMSGAIDMGSHKVTSVTDPTSAQDAATKNYVDTAVAALNPAESVYAATTANLVGTYLNGVAGIGATFTLTATGALSVDGVTPPLNSRILVKDQSTGFQNGIYTVTTLGSVGVSEILTRSLDYNTPSDINSGGLIPVINGTANALTSWDEVATITTIGTDALVFSEFTANPSSYLLKANNLSDVSSKTASFDNLSPMTTAGDLIVGGASGTGTRLAKGSNGTVLTMVAGSESWVTPSPVTPVASSISGNTTGASSVNIYFGDTSGGAFTFTLPAASSNTGVTFTVKNITFGGSNNIAISTSGGDTVEGAGGDTVTPGEGKTFMSNGVSWYLNN